MKNFILAVSILFNIVFVVRYFVQRAEKAEMPVIIPEAIVADTTTEVSQLDHIGDLILKDERDRLPITIQGIDFVSSITVDSVRLIGDGSEGMLFTTWKTVQPTKTIPVVVKLEYIIYNSNGTVNYSAEWSDAEHDIFSRRLYGR